LDKWNDKRIRAAKRYRKNLEPLEDYYMMPKERNYCKEVYHLFPLYVKNNDPDELAKYLNERGVSTSKHYPLPVHKTLAYSAGINLVVSEVLVAGSLTLPMHPFLEYKDVDYVCKCLKDFISRDLP
jgi:dTDP-4-amino-4,6-dideoxygalactose transaminase